MDNNESGQLLGLAQASIAGSFTTSPSVISLIYDAMTIERHSGSPEPKHMPSASFAIVASPAARGRSIELTLSGFAQPPGAGSLALQIGGVHSTVQPTEESYYTTVTATLNADADTTPVIVTLDLPKPADDSQVGLQLDAIDVRLPDCPAPG
jgi:hypothetical protein